MEGGVCEYKVEQEEVVALLKSVLSCGTGGLRKTLWPCSQPNKARLDRIAALFLFRDNDSPHDSLLKQEILIMCILKKKNPVAPP